MGIRNSSRRADSWSLARLVATAAVLACAPALAWPAFPGDDGRLAFETNRDGNYEIYTLAADGTSPTRITTNTVFDRQPAWSPDGTKVAFSSNRGGPFEIWVANADGSDAIRITTTTSRDNYPAWSPDGTKIAFARSNSDTGFDDIWIASSADGSGLTQLTFDDQANESQPAWSPDGSKIAFVTDRDGDSEVYVMGSDGSSPVDLSQSALSTDASPDWSPDGSRIAFDSDRADGFTRVYTMAADGSDVEELDGTLDGDGQPVWSPDGLSIAFSGYRDGTDDKSIFRIDVGSAASRTILSDPLQSGYNDVRPDWQPIPGNQQPENHPPTAEAGPGARIDCAPSGGASVVLDGSASSDPDSTPGTHDDIVSFDWYLAYGGQQQMLLGHGETLSVTLPAGVDVVTLVVTDKAGATGTDEATWTIAADTTPPTLSLSVDPAALWPPDHRMVPVHVTAGTSDACGPATIRLVSATSSEPDDARGGGDGTTRDDIQGASTGTEDLDVSLRAERDGSGPGRIYTLVYSATDAAGNSVVDQAVVVVPHDVSGGEDPRNGSTSTSPHRGGRGESQRERLMRR